MTSPSTAETLVERWSLSLDSEAAARSERDLGRALLLQNARFATRFDPMRRHRSAQTEGRIRLFAMGLSVFGALLGAILVVGRYATTGEILLRDVGLFVLLVSLFFVFWFQQSLRQAWVSRLDRVLWKRAAKVMEKSLSDRRERHYEIEAGEVRRIAEGEPIMTHSLTALPYGLIGDASILLFKTRTTQNPGMILLISTDERERIVTALENAGASLERLAESLLPPLNVRRRW